MIGFVNGFVVVRLGVSSFIATLGMGTILVAVQTIITNGSTPPPVTSSFWNDMTQHMIFGFQIVVLYLIVLAIILWWALGHTPFGRYLYATGSNAEAARLSGIRTGLWSWTSLVLSAAISSLAGCFYVSLTGPDLSFGATLLLPSFAAVFLGSTQLIRGKFNVWGTLVAIIVLATGAQGLQLVTGVQWIQDMFNGVALILAVSLRSADSAVQAAAPMSWLRIASLRRLGRPRCTPRITPGVSRLRWSSPLLRPARARDTFVKAGWHVRNRNEHKRATSQRKPPCYDARREEHCPAICGDGWRGEYS